MPDVDHIFVVDDDTFFLSVFSKQLESALNAKVSCLTRAQQFIDLVKKDRNCVEVLFCDLKMPELDGIQLLQKLAELRFPGKIVLLSGAPNRTLELSERLAKSLGLNTLGILQKPCSTDQIQKILDQSQISENPDYQTPYDPEISSEFLIKALERKEFYTVFQPQVCLTTGRLVGFEALLRWQLGGSLHIKPDHFIPYAERFDYIDDLTMLVLKDAAEAYFKLLEHGIDVKFSVNVSLQSLASNSFSERLVNFITEHDFPADRLVLEITESQALTNVHIISSAFLRLKLRGIQFGIDDFGTGFSSMIKLIDLPFDELKIDRKFVSPGHSSQQIAQVILKSCTRLGKQLGMRVVCEGVETQNQWTNIVSIGAEVAQGYFISKPLNLNAIMDWHTDWKNRVITILKTNDILSKEKIGGAIG